MIRRFSAVFPFFCLLAASLSTGADSPPVAEAVAPADLIAPRAETDPAPPPAGEAVPRPTVPPDGDDPLHLEDEEYYRLIRLLAEVVDQVDRNYVEKVDRRKLVEAMIRGALDELDPYCEFISPQELQEFRVDIENRFGGLGLQVTVRDGRAVVVSPLPDGPAFRAGILSGDRILKIDGRSTEGRTVDELSDQLHGQPGSVVSLTVMHPHDESVETIQLRRAEVRVPTVCGVRLQADGQWDYWLDREAKIAYIRVSIFGQETAARLKEVVQQLLNKGMRGLVLDLRFNPGGLLGSAVDTCDLFVGSGVIVSTEGRGAVHITHKANWTGTLDPFEMVVLVNQYTASAAEIVAACLQDHGRAAIGGERTWGKGSVQTVIELEDGRSALKLTTAAYIRPSGENIHRFEGMTEEDTWGVMPEDDLRLSLSTEQMRELMAQRRRGDVIPSKNGEEHDAPAEETKQTPPQAEPEKSSDKPAPAAPVEPAVQPDSPPAASDSNDAFIDPQLEKCLDYLRGRLQSPRPSEG